MLSTAENMRMCQVGAGTPMGNALRRYWVPALLESEIAEPDCDPVRIEILGERLVAFRDTRGRIGILDEFCCHRGASLGLARNEDCGLRCIYHGWKFAVDGTVLETPNVADPKFKDRVRAKSYPAEAAGGVVWVYMGPEDQRPALHRFPWMDLPAEHLLTTIHFEECNFVQVTEGLLDSTHLGFLHADGLSRAGDVQINYAEKVGAMAADLVPDLAAADTEFGFHYAALRKGGEPNTLMARVTAFVAPFIVLNPNGDIATMVVPVNDTRALFIHVFWDAERRIGEEPLRGETLGFVGLTEAHLDSYGISRRTFGTPGASGLHDNFAQDRAAMRAGRTFSGLPGLIEEDVAVSVSSGPIRDRSREKLSTADIGIQRLYRTLLSIAAQVEAGETPTGLAPGIDHSGIVGTSGTVARGGDWQQLVPGHRPARRPVAARAPAE